MFLDLPEAELRAYTSAQVDPDDFDAFWADTLGAARRHPVIARMEPVDVGLRTIDVYDLRFRGFDGEEIAAWVRIPRNAEGPLPAVVQFHGYGRGRGDAVENLLWASAGLVHVEMDTRGQGWSGSRGLTPDRTSAGPQMPGFVTRGIEDPDDYYYRRVYTDAVRAVEAARSLDAVASDRVAVHGISQGGGIALAVAGLVPDLTQVVARVPFLCDFPRASVITDRLPFREISDYLAHYRDRTELVHRTLAYFDGVNFARRAQAPALITVALMDAVCPPSTVYAAYNAYAGPKRLCTWTYNGHEGGGVDDDVIALRTLQGALRVD
ncbi:acetylxylan esterase [Curtobacterium pusillum]|uniref:Prolyl oligopeptidase family serine peptidase n=1 Tax=Curtobacterium pusillum TaxID=69373 RepID=A0ABX2MHW2_9MICO|nr:acetylxylan esterase [Curtobacterium pusillum]NUU15139.1 prolyl oligopeptidase family serine peptidase [Curtobacterium pusillum]GLK31533.1 acetylxylan esterase [Curtobacterium pusillum]